MQSSLSLEEQLLKDARQDVREIGRVSSVVALLLEQRGINVGALETRLLTQQGAA